LETGRLPLLGLSPRAASEENSAHQSEGRNSPRVSHLSVHVKYYRIPRLCCSPLFFLLHIFSVRGFLVVFGHRPRQFSAKIPRALPRGRTKSAANSTHPAGFSLSEVNTIGPKFIVLHSSIEYTSPALQGRRNGDVLLFWPSSNAQRRRRDDLFPLPCLVSRHTGLQGSESYLHEKQIYGNYPTRSAAPAFDCSVSCLLHIQHWIYQQSWPNVNGSERIIVAMKYD
jgi:hypothetical protein